MLGAVGFETERRSFISRAIRWFTRSRWSHVFLVLPEDPVTREREIVEASFRGVYKDSIAKYRKRGIQTRIFLVDADMEDRIDALADRLTNVGARYGFLQVLGFALILPLRWIGVRVRNPLTGGYVCSEFVLGYLRELELNPRAFDDLDKDSTTPADLFTIIEEHPMFQEMEL